MSSSEEKKGFTVVDRRHWMDEDGAESAGQERKPTYVAQLEQALADKDQKLRAVANMTEESVADLSQAKERLARESQKEQDRTRRHVILDLLDVLDNLERALSALEEGHDIKSVIEGMFMVRELFLAKLEGYGIRRIEAAGERFDPAIHQAVTMVPVPDPKVDGIVIGEIRSGYTIGDELLRPAEVAVAKTSLTP
ncbi:MAG: nucleotide exchange factor GrpE [Myxococcota bacterium]|jgi:molecular chaperone GrpE|nr:nucleotide exchange factor GrpE [Myxococcota bacterium]